jgi:polar amino acid transport system ATP-binding protein
MTRERALLSIRDLGKQFGSTKVLNNVSLDVAESDVVSIIGASGSGKTTLLRCINLLETFEEGEIILDGQPIGYRMVNGRRHRLPERELARQRAMTGMVFQAFNLFPHLTALGNVMLGLTKVRRLAKPEARELALSWLSRVGLDDRALHYPSQLSGGQQQRVAIARALAMDPKLVLLDEVTSALDPELVQEVLQTITKLAEDGITLLIVTHEMAFAKRVSTRIVFMDHGRIAESGSAKQIFTNPATPRLKQFLRNAHV